MERRRAATSLLSEGQFLDWASLQEDRYELHDGVALMQAGATRDHERVAKRIFACLLRQVDETRFDVNKGNFGVRIRPGRDAGTILYPDVVVDRQSAAGDERATTARSWSSKCCRRAPTSTTTSTSSNDIAFAPR